jgi:hypothetical protein
MLDISIGIFSGSQPVFSFHGSYPLLLVVAVFIATFYAYRLIVDKIRSKNS